MNPLIKSDTHSTDPSMSNLNLGYSSHSSQTTLQPGFIPACEETPLALLRDNIHSQITPSVHLNDINPSSAQLNNINPSSAKIQSMQISNEDELKKRLDKMASAVTTLLECIGEDPKRSTTKLLL